MQPEYLRTFMKCYHAEELHWLREGYNNGSFEYDTERLDDFVAGLDDKDVKDFFYDHVNAGLNLDDISYEVTIFETIIKIVELKMDTKFIESMRCLNQIGAWKKYGKDALAVLSEGPPGLYEGNPTVNEYKVKGYKLVDSNMFGKGNETGEILIFVRKR